MTTEIIKRWYRNLTVTDLETIQAMLRVRRGMPLNELMRDTTHQRDRKRLFAEEPRLYTGNVKRTFLQIVVSHQRLDLMRIAIDCGAQLTPTLVSSGANAGARALEINPVAECVRMGFLAGLKTLLAAGAPLALNVAACGYKTVRDAFWSGNPELVTFIYMKRNPLLKERFWRSCFAYLENDNREILLEVLALGIVPPDEYVSMAISRANRVHFLGFAPEYIEALAAADLAPLEHVPEEARSSIPEYRAFLFERRAAISWMRIRTAVFELCNGLASLDLPAFQVYEICYYVWPEEAALIKMHLFWRAITTVKHFLKPADPANTSLETIASVANTNLKKRRQ